MSGFEELIPKEQVCPVCGNDISHDVCCPECGHECPLDMGADWCPVCSPSKPEKEKQVSK